MSYMLILNVGLNFSLFLKERKRFWMYAKNMSEMMMVGRISQGQCGVMHG